MTDPAVDKVTNDAVSKGGILATLYFDIHSKNKESLIQLSTGFIDSIIKTKGVIYAVGEINEAIENEEIFSTYVEVDVLTKDFLTLVNLCMLFNPVSLEIIKPNELRLSLDSVHELLTSISSEWFNIKKFVAERTSTKDDIETYKKYLENRIEIGKKLLEKKDGKLE